jgi:glutathione S-transferase
LKLITIPISHYCEKARWALELAKIDYVEEKHLQGFHFWPVYKAGKRDTAPVLITPEKVLPDSTLILQWVDSQLPESQKIYPLELKSEIEAFEEYLDEGFGVTGRLWMYTYMLRQLPLILKYSKKHGVPWYEIVLMPVVISLFKKQFKALLNLKPTSRQDSKAAVDKVLDEVAQRLSDGRPYLMGDKFTAADITFGALAAAVIIPEDNYGAVLPRLDELPDSMREQVKIWRKHPAGQYALKLYKEKRRR